jgi:hypothetical protein
MENLENKIETFEIYNNERIALREELHNLKNCQITFLTTSVTATGILLGLAPSIKPLLEPEINFLIPLVILLPSWWIFFDKATTITRIVGYYRILEKLIIQGSKAKKFLGWENALGEFRNAQERNELKFTKTKHNFFHWLIKTDLRTSHPYWIVSYFIFFGLSCLCMIGGIEHITTSHFLIKLLSILLVILSALWNAKTVYKLINGRNSYDANEQFWKHILDVK